MSFTDETLFGKEPRETLPLRSVRMENLAPGLALRFVPTGAIVAYWGTVAPVGWLLCDGSTFSAATYPALAALLGGTTLPNLKGRVIAGYDAAQTEFNAMGKTGGSKTIAVGDLAVHNHGGSAGSTTPGGTGNTTPGATGTVSADHLHGTNGINTTHTHHPQAKVRTTNTAHAHDNDSAEHSTSPSGSGTSFGTANVITDGDSVDHNHGNTGGASANHTHTSAAHTHTESAHTHSVSNDGSGTVGGKLPPYTALTYIIRAA